MTFKAVVHGSYAIWPLCNTSSKYLGIFLVILGSGVKPTNNVGSASKHVKMQTCYVCQTLKSCWHEIVVVVVVIVVVVVVVVVAAVAFFGFLFCFETSWGTVSQQNPPVVSILLSANSEKRKARRTSTSAGSSKSVWSTPGTKILHPRYERFRKRWSLKLVMSEQRGNLMQFETHTPPRSLTARPWKMVLGRLVPFLLEKGKFSGAMLNFGGVPKITIYVWRRYLFPIYDVW